MKRDLQRRIIQYIVLASLMTASTTVLTFFIKIPSHNGYIHLGDSVIFIASALLPTPLAMISAGLGGALADALGGYTLYIIPTLIIKMLLVLPFSSKGKKILTKRNIVALPVCAVITTIGYYVAEVILVAITATGSFGQVFSYLLSPTPWAAALYSIPGNIIQAIGSIVVFVPLAIALDKINIKGKI